MNPEKRPRRAFRMPLTRGASLRSEAEEEIRFHVESRTRKHIESGMPPTEARAEAERRFGKVGAIAEEVEELMRRREKAMRTHHLIDETRRNIAFAVRQLRRAPGFAGIAIFTIALAIASTTSVFSVVDGIMLRPLEYSEPDELVMLWADYTRRDVVLPDKSREYFSWPNFVDLRDQVPDIESASAFSGWNPTLTGVDTGAQRLNGAVFSAGMFGDVLGVDPAMGRLFTEEEDRPDGPLVAVISDGFWRRAFGADPAILNGTIRLDGQLHTVVGIMRPTFAPPPFLGSDVWAPLRRDPANTNGRGGASLRAVGRLTNAGNLELARAQAIQLGARLESEYPQANRDIGYNMYPLRDDLVRSASTALWILLGAVGFVLLIACVNVANLLLARGATRHGELAVRIAIGAGRQRVTSQLITESLILAMIGGALGISLSVIGTRALTALAPAGTPLLDQVSVDTRILAFAAAVTMLTGALFGILPALRASRTDPASALRAGGRSGGASGTARLRNSLVVGQVALALMLLMGAGLLVRSFQNLNEVDLGFEPDGVLTMQLQLPGVRYPDAASRMGFFVPLEERLTSLPGVVAAGSITNLPMAGFDGDNTFYVEGGTPPEPGLEPAVWLRRSTPGYFEAMGLELLRGRGFTASDDQEATRVIIVNETLERDYFDGNALGRRLNVNDPANPVWREVVGVVKDIKNFGIRAESRNALYLPYAQAPTTFMFTTLKTTGDPAALTATVSAEVARLDPDVALASVQTMEEVVAGSLDTERFTATLLGGFALVALLLAIIGLYGVVSFSVSTRLREMGVRIALGAPGGDIRRLILKWALSLAALGIIIGAGGAFGITRLLGDMLFQVAPTDVPTFLVVAGLMAAAAMLASLVPAIRATRVDPIEVLRSE